MKLLFLFLLAVLSIDLFATGKTKVADTSMDISKQTTGSSPFACSIGKFKVINFNKTGAFKKFSLDGVGLLVNSSYLHTNVASNKEIIYMVQSSDKYIENGKYLSVFCNKNHSQ